MGRRPQSPYQASTRNGNRFGIATTPRDKTRIAMLGRWYCLSPEHIAREELRITHNIPTNSNNIIGPNTPGFDSALRSVKQRFWKLSSVEKEPGNNIGPFIGSALVDDGQFAWYATRYGITAAGLPWDFRSSINPQFAAHAWMAADVGLQLEAMGYRVLSERELSSRIDKDGDNIDTPINSPYVNSSGLTTNKKPDVAVISPDERNFIAVEVERDSNRPLKTYAEKLSAYQANPACLAVWYVCLSQTTANRVGTAALNVLGQDSGYPLRIMVTEGTDRWYGINGIEQRPNWMKDLEAMK